MGVNLVNPPCPLCSASSTPYHRDTRRPYLKCQRCQLIHVPAPYLPTSEEEKAQYDLHENQPYDTGYRTFLNRLATPLLTKLTSKSHGLDYGCGPGPTLSVMLEEMGHTVTLHDPFYQPNPEALNQTYDFITATEVFEHLHQPAHDLDILYRALKPDGWLGIMTKRVQDHAGFAKWHYTHDPTHVCFWSESTFHWLAEKWKTTAEFHAVDVVLLQKK